MQNDILKEYLARKTYIYPPEPSLRLVTDVIEYCTAHLPRLIPISVCGYHMRQAGCDAVQEIALSLSNAAAYVQAAVDRGLAVDSFAPRFSFNLSTMRDFFEEIAKHRAARRIWARIMRERFGAEDPKSWMLRLFSGGDGTSLTAAEPYNNIVRITLQTLAIVLSGAQAVHTISWDEAIGLPTEESSLLALRTQQILAYESGVARSADPLGGSHLVEALTDEIDQRASAMMAEIEERGGVVEGIKDGSLEAGHRRFGLPASADDRRGRAPRGRRQLLRGRRRREAGDPAFTVGPEIRDRQLERLASVRKERDEAAVSRTLRELEAAARGSEQPDARHSRGRPQLCDGRRDLGRPQLGVRNVSSAERVLMALLPIVSLDHVGIASSSEQSPLADAVAGEPLRGTLMPSGVTVAHFGPDDLLELRVAGPRWQPDRQVPRAARPRPAPHRSAGRRPARRARRETQGGGVADDGRDRTVGRRQVVGVPASVLHRRRPDRARGRTAAVICDVIVRNGSVVIPELPAPQPVDVAITDGRVAALLDRGEGSAREREWDASGCVVMPGGIDPHVHVCWPYLESRTMDDYASASRAAAAGGTTTIMDFAMEGRDDPGEAVRARQRQAADASVVDFSFHLVVSEATPEVLEGLAEAVALGVTSFKVYMTYRRRGLAVDPATLAAIAGRVAELGGVLAVHAEAADIDDSGTAEMQRQRPRSGAGTCPTRSRRALRPWPSRPPPKRRRAAAAACASCTSRAPRASRRPTRRAPGGDSRRPSRPARSTCSSTAGASRAPTANASSAVLRCASLATRCVSGQVSPVVRSTSSAAITVSS